MSKQVEIKGFRRILDMIVVGLVGVFLGLLIGALIMVVISGFCCRFLNFDDGLAVMWASWPSLILFPAVCVVLLLRHYQQMNPA